MEAMWLFKIAEEDVCLYKIVAMPLHFFNVCFQTVKLEKASKASYVFQDRLRPSLAKWLCQSASKSEGEFNLIFDETTTNQQKQIDLLCFLGQKY